MGFCRVLELSRTALKLLRNYSKETGSAHFGIGTVLLHGMRFEGMLKLGGTALKLPQNYLEDTRSVSFGIKIVLLH